ncbi:MAG: hypothetical protein AB1705_02890 [Verrucomicrobiota bacterium]
MNNETEANEREATARRHIMAGWWAVLLFLTLGIVLELLHGFKVGWYLNVGNSTRRLMWTLAHAHGTLIGLLNVAFGLTVRHLNWQGRSLALASTALLCGAILLPGGFFLGGVVIYDGDPGLGILLVPVGAFALLLGIGLTARAATANDPARK